MEGSSRQGCRSPEVWDRLGVLDPSIALSSSHAPGSMPQFELLSTLPSSLFWRKRNYNLALNKQASYISSCNKKALRSEETQLFLRTSVSFYKMQLAKLRAPGKETLLKRFRCLPFTLPGSEQNSNCNPQTRTIRLSYERCLYFL